MAHEFLPGPVADRLEEEDRSILQRGERIEFEESVPSATGQVHTFLINKFPLTDATGATTGLCGIATDITDRKRAAEERALLQQQVIDSQRAALRELSTPLIPLSEGVLVVPLIGIIDRERGQMILEALLSGVTEQRAHTVIIDITGVRVVDSEIAQGLLRAARATRLLGAQTILTGLRAEVAKTLVQGGADFGGVVTLATLQAGIAYAMRIHPQ
jgi:anti-anti-sigma regulatory factor